MNSILNTVKKLLGIPEEYTQFDTDIIIHINSVFMILRQIGVGPKNGFSITDSTRTWNEYLDDSEMLESVKSYVYMRVRLLFDPPSSSFVLESMNKMISEIECRLNMEIETPENKEE